MLFTEGQKVFEKYMIYHEIGPKTEEEQIEVLGVMF
ncbi:hypothetical protein HNR53_003715 [Bacillus benzoevorans]|uniref:Uncharacterized protein n=1 Tax=Bacillus benzoevorans TaxID=1456 RepID=A0A7X0HUF5_9BACI|nr:hypothetical protein [Bacillus benzoevorans]